ncbi:hypothetical protein S58_43250 [Bradyrhizobium oligotrophicum S58]|uniref:Uncharacterized protein n=1 Tax=Bradyrhizobium oligotrophicum S58 TaxID=1245469 RepID=M4ZVE2_9BRAD|nr:hypothetical protein S58_43250 [Bradyrhizobium oligotrophicum S58]
MSGFDGVWSEAPLNTSLQTLVKVHNPDPEYGSIRNADSGMITITTDPARPLPAPAPHRR